MQDLRECVQLNLEQITDLFKDNKCIILDSPIFWYKGRCYCVKFCSITFDQFSKYCADYIVYASEVYLGPERNLLEIRMCVLDPKAHFSERVVLI